MRVPDTYYAELADRFRDVDLDLDSLAELGVLADRDDEGHLLQIFSRMAQDRPTVFFELIERHGARGFGEATSRRCSWPWSASRRSAATCRAGNS